jgi:hypothetical protein
MQGVPFGQAVPHAPQLAALVIRSTQADAHALSPLGQPSMQLPATHD